MLINFEMKIKMRIVSRSQSDTNAGKRPTNIHNKKQRNQIRLYRVWSRNKWKKNHTEKWKTIKNAFQMKRKFFFRLGSKKKICSVCYVSIFFYFPASSSLDLWLDINNVRIVERKRREILRFRTWYSLWYPAATAAHIYCIDKNTIFISLPSFNPNCWAHSHRLWIDPNLSSFGNEMTEKLMFYWT